MLRAGTSRASTGLWAAAVLVLVLCVSPLLFSSTTNLNNNQPHRWQFRYHRDVIPDVQHSPQDAAVIPNARRDAAVILDARRGPAHSDPLKLAPYEPLFFEEPADTSSADLSPRSLGLPRRDGPLYCNDGPCVDGSCCGPDNICGFGPDFCGEGCRFNCTATAMCGEHSEFAQMPCGMKLCCSSSGWCGSTEVYCHNADPLRGTLPCQAGYGSCYITGPPSCPYGGGTTGGRHIGYYQSWNVRNRLCNKVSPRQLNTTGYTHFFYSFASIDPGTFRIAAAHPDDPDMMREFTSLAKPGLKTWIAIGGFDFSDKGTPTHRTWSEMVASRDRRAAFISSVKDYMDEYGFTGVDIDWEYPGDPDRGGNKLADTRKLVLLMREMRAAYGNNYGISLTLAPDYWYLRWFDAKAMEPYVDFFGFMAYDLHGPWDADVKALGSKVRGQADIREISENTKPLWFDGLNPAKLNFGLALYGRGYTLADPTCNQLLCPFSGGSKPAPCTNFEGVMSLHEIPQLIDRKGLTPQYLPDAMMKQITWDDQWIGYDDDETFAAKKAWADSRCFGGTMVWSIDFQVAGSGDAEGEKYGDVVYIGQEVFETPAAQCPAPCIMVFPSSSLPEPKVITMQPYTATLEVGITTTTIVAVSTPSTTTVTAVNFFNHYVTKGQQPGAVVTMRPSFQPPPVMLVVTGQDGQTTTILFSSSVTSSRSTSRGSSIILPQPTDTGGQHDILGPEQQELSDESDDDEPTPTPIFPNETEVIEPVKETDDPPPPGKTRLKCDTWFFNICINWPELDISIDWWDIELPPGDIGPGPLPVRYLKFPPGWSLGCLTPPCSLPPWPKIRIGGGGGLLPVTPPAPNPCKPVTATLTISTTSYGTTTTEGTARTITTRTMSSEFPILGCALTDATVSVSKTACATPRPTPRSIDDEAAGSELGSTLVTRDDGEDSGEDCDDSEKLIDVVVVPDNPLSANSLIIDELNLAKTENHEGGKNLEDYTIISSATPTFVAFFYLKNVKEGYAKRLRGQFGLAGQAYRIPPPPPPSTPPTTPPGRKRHIVKSLVQTNTTLESAANVQRRRQKQKLVKRTADYGPNYGLAHLGIPPELDFLDVDGPLPFIKPDYYGNRHGFLYQRHASECEDQFVYIIENAFDRQHSHFRHLRTNMNVETLPRKIYGNWEGHVEVDPEHATNVASIVAGEHNGVCPLGLLTVVGTEIPGSGFPGTVDPEDVRGPPLKTKGMTWMYTEALVEALKDIQSKNRGTKSVINMSWGVKTNQDETDAPIRKMLSLLLQQLDNLGVVLVAATGNTLDQNDPFFKPRIPDHSWPQTAEDVPNLILVGASTQLSRVALFSNWPAPWYDEDEDEYQEVSPLFAPGEGVIVSTTGLAVWGGINGLTVEDGTSFAAPQVAGLVAYLRAMERRLEPKRLLLNNPSNVKLLLSHMSRVVWTEDGAAHPGPFEDESGGYYGKVVNVVWNGQWDDNVECIFNPGEHCPPGDFRGCLWSDSDGAPARKRQTSGSCPYLPGNPGNGGGNPGPGNGGGGGDGGDVGGQDQLGPSKTFTYNTGTPSPTCTSGCGTLCTDFWCRPDRTGQPLHFTEPTRLPTITPAPGGGDPMPTNCISSTTTRTCHGDRQGQTFGIATVCVATACPESSVCGPEVLPPLPGPTSLDCTGDWFTTTSAWCAGSGDKQACTTTTVCAITPSVTPVFRYIIATKCPKDGDVCAQVTADVECTGNQARGVLEPTAVLPAVTEAPTPPSPSQELEETHERRAAVKPPRRPRPVANVAVVAPAVVVPEAAVSPANNVMLQPRQDHLLCDVTARCAKCETPKPNIPDPCIKIRMTEVLTGANFRGIEYKAEVTLNGKSVCKLEADCGMFAGSVEQCWGVRGKYDCGNGNRVDSWKMKHFSFYSKANDKVYEIETKPQAFEGVWDPCNGSGFMCIATVYRGQGGEC
ncbi:hypothetical protein B0T21DRAFT_411737 [Apiosordaria backusii]|uniref:chitinase n=1 Tax=Apiosordaria backusii TaxID=314023 RepID=A0AA40BLU4_9PEZI|nr:hypothetical protein B0T21DRAFT_411737 [Apiosordaria backusii]